MVSTLVLLDMSKAFDCVIHSILLAKLSRYGIHDVSLSWFKSYLENRTQMVKIGTQLSSERPVTTGVPQGSILGPLLFLVAVNDLPNVVQNCKVTLFADDIQLCISHRPEHTPMAYDNLQRDLESIENWCKKNGLKNNLEKTQVISVATSQNRKNLPENAFLSVGGTQMAFCEKSRIWVYC